MGRSDDGSRSLYVFINRLEYEDRYAEGLRLCKLCAEALRVGDAVQRLITYLR